MNVFTDRFRRLEATFAVHGIDAALISKPANVRYLTGYTGSNGVVVLGSGARRFLTDSRYATSVEQLRAHVDVEIVNQALLGVVADRYAELFGGARVGFESSYLPYGSWQSLESASNAGTLVPVERLVEPLREIKDGDEIAALREGCSIVNAVYAHLAETGLSGRREADIADLISAQMRMHGASGPSFGSIVGSGANGAKPHHIPGGDVIERSTLVVLDFGALVDGYFSDCTRTFATGATDDEMRAVYAAVLAAQEASLSLVKPGVSCLTVHDEARRVIRDAGYAEYFNHGTGHGVGLEIHEEPRFREGFAGELVPGNVVTVEPGIYLPGRFGVRIEVLVVVTESGHEVLTNFPKSLLTVD